MHKNHVRKICILPSTQNFIMVGQAWCRCEDGYIRSWWPNPNGNPFSRKDVRCEKCSENCRNCFSSYQCYDCNEGFELQNDICSLILKFEGRKLQINTT